MSFQSNLPAGLPFGRQSRWMLPAAWIATFAALLGASAGSGGTWSGFGIALLLNPIAWLAFYWFYRQDKVRCPHCGMTADYYEVRNLPLFAPVHCSRCGNHFQKPAHPKVLSTKSHGPHTVTNIGITVNRENSDQNVLAPSREECFEQSTDSATARPACSEGTESLAASTSQSAESHLSPNRGVPFEVVHSPRIEPPSAESLANRFDQLNDRLLQIQAKLADIDSQNNNVQKSLSAFGVLQGLVLLALLGYFIASSELISRNTRRTAQPARDQFLDSRKVFRTWTDHRGRTIFARLLNLTDGAAVFEQQDGKQISVELKNLSDVDKAIVLDLTAVRN